MPSKRVWAALPMMDQNRRGDQAPAKLAMAEALAPALAVRLNWGSRLAIATPISAVAACILASAARTSGRLRTMEAGRLSGRSDGRRKQANSNFSGMPSPGPPARQRGHQIAVGGKPFSQRLERLLELRKRYFLRGHIDTGGLIGIGLLLEKRQHLGGDSNTHLGRFHLFTEGCLLD